MCWPVDRRMNGWVDVLACIQMENGWVDVLVHRQMDEWMSGWVRNNRQYTYHTFTSCFFLSSSSLRKKKADFWPGKCLCARKDATSCFKLQNHCLSLRLKKAGLNDSLHIALFNWKAFNFNLLRALTFCGPYFRIFFFFFVCTQGLLWRSMESRVMVQRSLKIPPSRNWWVCVVFSCGFFVSLCLQL